jgi:hypothetical protein
MTAPLRMTQVLTPRYPPMTSIPIQAHKVSSLRLYIAQKMTRSKTCGFSPETH